MVNRREYFRHFMMLLTGSAGAQVINLASYPILARLYDPLEFGIFAVFLAISAVPVAIACGRFDLAVPIARPHLARTVHALCILIAIGAGLISVIGVGVYIAIAGSYSWTMAPLIGASVFLGGYCAASTMLSLRHDGYRVNSFAIIARTVVGNGAQIALALAFAASGLNLILGYCLGQLIQALMLHRALRGIATWKIPPRRALRLAFTRFRAQVAIDIPSTILGATALNLLTWFLLILYGPLAVGFYAIANRIAVTPLAVFNDTLSQVFFQKASKAERERGSFWPELKLNLAAAGAVAIVVLIGILLVAPPIIGVYLGERWLPSAETLVLLAPMLAIRSIGVSVATSVFVLRKPSWLLYLNIALVAGYSFGFLWAWTTGAIERNFLIATVVSISVVYIIFTLVIAWATYRSQRIARTRIAMPKP